MFTASLSLQIFLVEAGYSAEVEQLMEYVQGLGKQPPEESTTSTSGEYATTVQETVEDLLTITTTALGELANLSMQATSKSIHRSWSTHMYTDVQLGWYGSTGSNTYRYENMTVMPCV